MKQNLQKKEETYLYSDQKKSKPTFSNGFQKQL